MITGLLYRITKWRQSNTSQTEIHLSPGYADDRNIQQDPKEHMSKEYPYATDKEPDDIEEGIETATSIGAVCHMGAERPETKYSQFESLNAKRNTDNGTTEGKARCEILQCGGKSAEQQP